MNKVELLIKILEIGAKCCRWLNLGTLPRIVHDLANGRLLEDNHQLAHTVRKIWLKDITADRIDEFIDLTERLCNEASCLLAEILQLRNNDIHCTLKVFARSEEDVSRVVAVTIGRSESASDRPLDFGFEKALFVDESTVFSTLLGQEKGVFPNRPTRCFSSSDLVAASTRFSCPRENWRNHYQSTLAVPLRYYKNSDEGHQILGALTFDRPTAHGFPSMPEIFAFGYDEFHEQANSSLLFHQSGLIADMLTMALYNSLPED